MSGRETAADGVSARLGRVAETAGLWLLVLVLGTAWLVFSFALLQAREAETMKRQRLAISLIDVQEAVEADLALGFDLMDDPHVAALLDRALERDPALRAIDVAGRNGVAIYSTDRGAVGEALAAEVLAAARRPGSSGTWAASVAGEPVLGTALRGPFGETVGHAVVAYRPEAVAHAPVALRGLVACLLVSVCGGALAWWLVQRRRRQRPEDEAPPSAALKHAEMVRRRFQAGLARIDENERST